MTSLAQTCRPQGTTQQQARRWTGGAVWRGEGTGREGPEQSRADRSHFPVAGCVPATPCPVSTWFGHGDEGCRVSGNQLSV